MPGIAVGGKNRFIVKNKHQKRCRPLGRSQTSSALAQSKKVAARPVRCVTKGASVRLSNAGFKKEEALCIVEVARRLNVTRSSKRHRLESLIRRIDACLQQSEFDEELRLNVFKLSSVAQSWLRDRLNRVRKFAAGSTVFVRGAFDFPGKSSWLSVDQEMLAVATVIGESQRGIVAVQPVRVWEIIKDVSYVRVHPKSIGAFPTETQLLCVHPSASSETSVLFYFDELQPPAGSCLTTRVSLLSSTFLGLTGIYGSIMPSNVSVSSAKSKKSTAATSGVSTDSKISAASPVRPGTRVTQCYLESWYTQSYQHLVRITKQSRDLALLVLEYTAEPLEESKPSTRSAQTQFFPK